MLRPIRPYPLMPTLIAIVFETSFFENLLSQHFVERLAYLGARKSKLIEQYLGGRRGAEMIDAHDLAPKAYIVPPGSANARLHRHPTGDFGRQHAILVAVVMGIE